MTNQEKINKAISWHKHLTIKELKHVKKYNKRKRKLYIRNSSNTDCTNSNSRRNLPEAAYALLSLILLASLFSYMVLAL
jgi:hypothetical protein